MANEGALRRYQPQDNFVSGSMIAAVVLTKGRRGIVSSPPTSSGSLTAAGATVKPFSQYGRR